MLYESVRSLCEVLHDALGEKKLIFCPDHSLLVPFTDVSPERIEFAACLVQPDGLQYMPAEGYASLLEQVMLINKGDHDLQPRSAGLNRDPYSLRHFKREPACDQKDHSHDPLP